MVASGDGTTVVSLSGTERSCRSYPCLDHIHAHYCNIMHVELPLKTVMKLQLVQNAATHMLTGASSNHSHVMWPTVAPSLFPYLFKAQLEYAYPTNGVKPETLTVVCINPMEFC